LQAFENVLFGCICGFKKYDTDNKYMTLCGEKIYVGHVVLLGQ